MILPIASKSYPPLPENCALVCREIPPRRCLKIPHLTKSLGVSGWTERWFVLEGKRVMYYNQKGDRHPRGTLELNAGSRLKKIPTREHAFHVVSDKQVCLMILVFVGQLKFLQVAVTKCEICRVSGVMVDGGKLSVSCQPACIAL